MRRRILGASGLRVSAIGLGTATWGAGADAAEAARIMSDFLDAGGDLVDATPVPGGADAERSVRMLRHVLARMGVRDDVVLTASSGVDAARPVGRRVDCSRKSLLAGLDSLLAGLGVDHLDLWSPGYWDAETPPEEVADTLEHAVRSGRVRYAGVRGYSGWQLAVTHAASGRIRPVAAQHEFSLLQRGPEDGLLPACDYLGVGFIAGAPLAQGVLTGKYRHSIPEDSRGASEHADAEVQDYLDAHGATVVGALCTAAEGLGVAPAVAALAWARDRPGVSSVLAGARTRAQLRELLATDDVVLPPAIAGALDDVSA
ncbi:aldo/keto reductase [Corynebacterium sp.]|uniref:aldo/keto reductase n=1 Tax=Corynebacterium sp. TaxID=1720 RepID=UPI0026DAC3F4|nr:aldo/keto reductase [Corynebacterium sp.]MDO4609348.1 aldo/keto reductase [Corynebacterium sp.]